MASLAGKISKVLQRERSTSGETPQHHRFRNRIVTTLQAKFSIFRDKTLLSGRGGDANGAARFRATPIATIRILRQQVHS
jgi:hypothetical protein